MIPMEIEYYSTTTKYNKKKVEKEKGFPNEMNGININKQTNF